jgi:integrase/recombinase XerC
MTSLEGRTHGVTAEDYGRVVLALAKQHPDPWACSTSDLEAFVRRPRTRYERPPSKYTMKREQVVLRTFYAWCAKRYDAPNPAEELSVIKIPRSLPKPIDPRWIDRAVKAERDPRWRCVVLLAADAGLRRGEISGLKWEHVDIEQGWLVVDGKGGKERTVPFTGRLQAALQKVPRHGGYVITNREGERLHPMNLLRVVQLVFERVGLPGATVHRLRHTFGTEAFRVGGNPRAIQDTMGHASLATTMLYAEVSAKDKQELIKRLQRPAP